MARLAPVPPTVTDIVSAEARCNLVSAVHAYIADFLGELLAYLTWPDRARLVPQVLRLVIARDDADLVRILFDATGV